MKKNIGFILRCLQGVIYLGVTVVLLIDDSLIADILIEEWMSSLMFIVLAAALGVVNFILAFLGKKHKAANTILLILSVFTLPSSIFGLLGAILGNQYLTAVRQEQKQTTDTPTTKNMAVNVPSVNTTVMDNNTAISPLKKSILDLDEKMIIEFQFDGQETPSNYKIIGNYYDEYKKLYAILEEIGATETDLLVAEYNEANDTVVGVEMDLAVQIYQQWQASLNEAPRTKRQQVVNDAYKSFDLYDTFVSNADWRSFRKKATQEELAIVAIGAKYRIFGVKPLLRALLSIVGIIGCLVGAIYTVFHGKNLDGVYLVIALLAGVGFFSVLANKLIGYSDTFSSSYRKLDKEHKAYVDQFYPNKWYISLLVGLMSGVLLICTFPFLWFSMLLDIFLQHANGKLAEWKIKKGINCKVITLPKGYECGNLSTLSAAGAYYESITFGKVWDHEMAETARIRKEEEAKYEKYEYRSADGSRKTAYSRDGRNFYDAPCSSHIVGHSSDGGRTITEGN